MFASLAEIRSKRGQGLSQDATANYYRSELTLLRRDWREGEGGGEVAGRGKTENIRFAICFP